MKIWSCLKYSLVCYMALILSTNGQAQCVNYDVTNIAGRVFGYIDANGTSAKFRTPFDVAIDLNGNIIVADYFNHRIRSIDQNGDVTTIAGTGSSGFLDANGSSAKFNRPSGVAVDLSGNIIVADLGNNRIRKIAPNGDVSTLAGNGVSGSVDDNGSAASFDEPIDLTIDRQGNIIVSDFGNNRIRKITSNGDVTTLAGQSAGYNDANGIAASFSGPIGLAVDENNDVLVADYFNHRIRKIAPNGDVTTLAGSTSGHLDGDAALALFKNPQDVAIDSLGNIIVVDRGNHRIKSIGSDLMVSTIAGSGISGANDDVGILARFNQPTGVAVDHSGNLIISDGNNNRIRKIAVCGPCVPTSGATAATGCTFVEVNSFPYNVSGTYMQTLTNVAGCDSILTIEVTVIPENITSDDLIEVDSCFDAFSCINLLPDFQVLQDVVFNANIYECPD